MERRRTRAWITAVALTVAVANLGTSGASGAQPSTVPAGLSQPQTVTLVTGDRVVITALGNGARGVTVEPAPGRSNVTFAEQQTDDGGLRIIPADAMRLLAAGRLDPRLFDVTGLIEQGYDDASSPQLPLIVTYDGDAPTADDRAAAGTHVERELPSIGGAAVRVPRQATGQVWEQLADADGARALHPDVESIWLDGRVEATLDESVPMVGAPAAWEAGYTGDGVRVAVLDTGLDADHPDLADAVVEAANFTDSYSGTDDLFGHGTHVSSIVTGSGAASDSLYTGVAPDADLLVGKVLDDFGAGMESWAIAGMEWAVAQDAAVVNLSLGGCSTDGTDPMSQAVNTLSEQSGALFVVAAGNHPTGSCIFDEAVSTPAAADHSLAVGSVTKRGELSEFSNVGPRLGDGALKPELTAPGESIVAARAEDTYNGEPVGERYVRLSGTSMAAPHVAGVAALLAEQHPDWTAPELRSALLASAVPRPDLGAYFQGAGRVDAARAVGQQLTTSPASLSLGLVPWPHDDDEPVTTTLTYRNSGDEPVTLDLSVTAFDDDGKPAPDGLFDLTPAHVTVPADGSTEVAVTADTSTASPDGAYSGWVSGAPDNGTTAVTTPVGVVKEVESYDLTVEAIDRDGNPAWTFAGLGDLGAETLRNVSLPGEPVTIRLPAGLYDLATGIQTPSQDEFGESSWTLAARPEIVLDQDLQVTLDARDARPIQAVIDNPVARPSLRRGFLDTYRQIQAVVTDSEGTDLFATSTAEVTAYDYTFTFQSAMSDIESSLHRGYQLYLSVPGRIPDPTFRVRDEQLAQLDTTVHSQGSAEYHTGTLRALPVPVDGGWSWTHSYDVMMPSRRIDLYSEDTSVRWASELEILDVVESDYFDESLPTYRAGQRYDKHWNAAPIGPVARPVFHGDFLFTTVSPFSPSSYRHFTSPDWLSATEMSTTLTKDGEVVGTNSELNGGWFDLPAEPGTYELTTSARRESEWSVLATQVDARWSVTAAPDEKSGRLPMLTLRTSGDVDLLGRAPARRPFKLDVVVERADGHDPTVRSISLEVSFDDGASWQRLRMRPVGDGFTTLAPQPPKDAEFVSLRSSAEDADGSQVEQTVIRAYQLTP